ncbi:LysR family transcriptional regulator [Streptomyces sp. IMTB 2501]|uniref:LysR family transcriptional regulator substrate-binding protein n=1 Tax=Streptomyces sp. IMTB 2501 TaxID=1776340 RepID=UPI00096E89A2|nr:LysR family transcriptional regulator substrate-binding protein [Streptomyces sp. IMTB 2501]OLZ72022.1 LysR family transcriptional regulator [Streptomyces sp. IMTB 2501]
MTGSEESPSFRLAYVPGVTPAKWVRIWNERLPDIPLTLVQVPAAQAPEVLRAGEADAGLVRLPVDRTYLSAIPLYTETTVVVVPKDHLITAADEVTVADLAEEVLFHPLDDVFDWAGPPGEPAFERPATTPDAIELVAANVGLLVVPQSLARLYHRKDLTYRPVTDAPQSSIALSWPEEATTDLVEDFIGIVRGRTVNSTRGRAKPPAEQSRQRSEPKGTRQKPAAKATGRTPRTRAAGGNTRTAGARQQPKRGKPRRRS